MNSYKTIQESVTAIQFDGTEDSAKAVQAALGSAYKCRFDADLSGTTGGNLSVSGISGSQRVGFGVTPTSWVVQQTGVIPKVLANAAFVAQYVADAPAAAAASAAPAASTTSAAPASTTATPAAATPAATPAAPAAAPAAAAKS